MIDRATAVLQKIWFRLGESDLDRPHFGADRKRAQRIAWDHEVNRVAQGLKWTTIK